MTAFEPRGEGSYWQVGAGIAIVLALTASVRSDDTDHRELPTVNCTVSCGRAFSPTDPIVTVVYSNASKGASVSVIIPSGDGERRLIGPGVEFDGVRGELADRDYDNKYGDIIPTKYEVVPAGRSCAVTYRLADRYRIPKVWTNMEVLAVHSYQNIEYVFVFDRAGLLVRTDLLRRIDRAEVLADRDRVLEGRARWEAMRRTGTPHRVRSNPMNTNVGVLATVAPAVRSGPPEDRANSILRSARVSPRTIHFSGQIFAMVLLALIAVGALVTALRRRHGANHGGWGHRSSGV